MVHQFQSKICIMSITAVLIMMSPAQAQVGGFLNKLKSIEKTAYTVTKLPKVQADVGGVKLDLDSCSAKTGVKTIDNSTTDKTKDKCGTQNKSNAPAKVDNTPSRLEKAARHCHRC